MCLWVSYGPTLLTLHIILDLMATKLEQTFINILGHGQVLLPVEVCKTNVSTILAD